VKKRGGYRLGAGRKRGRKEEVKLTEEEKLALLGYVEARRRRGHLTLRRACDLIAAEEYCGLAARSIIALGPRQVGCLPHQRD